MDHQPGSQPQAGADAQGEPLQQIAELLRQLLQAQLQMNAQLDKLIVGLTPFGKE